MANSHRAPGVYQVPWVNAQTMLRKEQNGTADNRCVTPSAANQHCRGESSQPEHDDGREMQRVLLTGLTHDEQPFEQGNTPNVATKESCRDWRHHFAPRQRIRSATRRKLPSHMSPLPR